MNVTTKILLALYTATSLCIAHPVLADPGSTETAQTDGLEADEGSRTTKPEKAIKSNTQGLRCSGHISMSNGMVLPKGKYALSIRHTYVHKDDLYDGGDKKTGNYTGKYELTDHIVQLTAKAGLFDDFEARIMVPWHDREQKQKSGNPPTHSATVNNTGLGDVVLMGRYALSSERKGDWLSLALGAGLSMPTGDTDKKSPGTGANAHEYMGPGFQLGSGSWDPKFEFGATKTLGRSRLDAYVMYTVSNDGAHGSRKGNQLKYNLGYGYALNRCFDALIEINGVDQEASRHDHESTENTGGHTVYLTPGICWRINKAMQLSMGVPVVIYRNLNGESQSQDWKSKYGLGEDYRVVTTLGFKF